ncbi:endonuclease VII [Mycobacterium phage Thibault]|uniref:Endonuclease VII n=1 Tax=Mycobacterium phage Thibault TaxID=1052673 RepID=G1FG96_9CAUD|nr:endonuclease VII [Mycobacterium phage Thibault]AEJ94163.1 endonuclease VII [Mycobacterium phage Thibault]
MRTCATEDCSKTKIVGWGYCAACYARNRKRGTLPVPTCPVRGCENARHKKSFCLQHREELEASGAGYCKHPECKQPIKPLDAFPNTNGSSWGKRWWCFDCLGRRKGGVCPMDGCDNPSWHHGPCKAHRARFVEEGKRWCTNPDCDEPLQPVSGFSRYKDRYQPRCKRCQQAAQSAKWHEDPESSRERYRGFKYGVGPEALNALMEEQDYRCAACSEPLSWDGDPGTRRACVDHDHACCPGTLSCGKCLRSILCNGCNVLLGRIEGNPFIKRREVEARFATERPWLVEYRDRWDAEMVRRGVRRPVVADVMTQWFFAQVEEVLTRD